MSPAPFASAQPCRDSWQDAKFEKELHLKWTEKDAKHLVRERRTSLQHTRTNADLYSVQHAPPRCAQAYDRYKYRI